MQSEMQPEPNSDHGRRYHQHLGTNGKEKVEQVGDRASCFILDSRNEAELRYQVVSDMLATQVHPAKGGVGPSRYTAK